MSVLSGSIASGVVSVTTCRPNFADWTSGETYELANDIAATAEPCMRIGEYKNNIVLDCKGHKLSRGTGTAIYVRKMTASNSLVIKNCIIQGFQWGIDFYDSDNVKIINCTINSSSAKGINLDANSVNNWLENNTITNCGSGVVILKTGNTLLNNVITGSTNDGIFVDNTGLNNKFINNVVEKSGDSGINLLSYASDNNFTDNRFCDNNQKSQSYNKDIRDQSPSTLQIFNGYENCNTSSYSPSVCDITCLAVCGDSNCEPSEGETEITCPEDCFSYNVTVDSADLTNFKILANESTGEVELSGGVNIITTDKVLVRLSSNSQLLARYTLDQNLDLTDANYQYGTSNFFGVTGFVFVDDSDYADMAEKENFLSADQNIYVCNEKEHTYNSGVCNDAVQNQVQWSAAELSGGTEVQKITGAGDVISAQLVGDTVVLSGELDHTGGSGTEGDEDIPEFGRTEEGSDNLYYLAVIAIVSIAAIAFFALRKK